MAGRTHLEAHLTGDELGQRYRRCPDPVERSHWQIIWLLSQGKTQAAVTQVTGYSRAWIGELVRRYNADGAAGLVDGRHANPGRPPLLTAEQQARLVVALDGPAPDGGLWTGPKVAAWIAAETDHPSYPQLGWTYLVRLGARLTRPRPQHAKADPVEQAAFPKA